MPESYAKKARAGFVPTEENPVVPWEAIQGDDLGSYANGGPILGPTILSSLRTGRPYAIAGESGPESVVPGGQRADIHVYLDGELLADKVGARLVDTIRIRQGI